MTSPFLKHITTHPLTLDKPKLQSFYFFDPAADPPQWRPASSSKDIIINPNDHQHSTDKLHLITWNIDFQVPFPRERMTAALKHLHQILSSHNNASSSSAKVIFFQEMVSSDLDLIQETDWIRERLYVTDLSPASWRLSSYGTTTLVDRRLDVHRVFRVPYATSYMQRDALFVDFGLNLPSSATTTTAAGGGGGEQGRVLRLCNTHLESLASGTPKRPVQMQLAAEFMHGRDNTNGLPTPHAAVLAGDLNAFAPEDALIPETCGLRDAFLFLGGMEETDEAYTWGKQNSGWLVGRFPDARLDKVLFCGGVEVVRLERIGVGVMASVGFDGGASEDEEDEEEVWVTDHYGLEAEFVITTAVSDSV
ncbi:Endonuclease/exonuclease/phosphatase [Aspergillus pseudoustus]|uniref:Endonuclease/exonuclease/phosphatase n=1 Tax=Aspergillus pseudoustus TaxID=1810923 RepID=A0ABR4JHY6_9EURO